MALPRGLAAFWKLRGLGLHVNNVDRPLVEHGSANAVPAV